MSRRATSAPRTTGGAGAPKVLVVDDLNQNIIALEASIGRADLQLLKANSGPQALEVMLQHDIALALVDVQMPGMDGFELAELMRGNERTRHIPIIFLTAAIGDPSRQFRGYEAGAVDFLSKPFDAFVLRSKIDVFLQLYDQKRRLAEKLAELEESLRLNELFTAVLGHDLRSPLSSVLTNAEILKRMSPDGEIARVADRIGASGARMSRMISQILDLARVRARSFRLSPSSGDLRLVCIAVQEEMEPSGAEKRLLVECSGDTRASFDADRVAQMLTNLASNALEHGTAGKPVKVAVDGTRPDRVTISVHNRGSIAVQSSLSGFQSPGRTSLAEPPSFPSLGSMSVSERTSSRGLGLGLHIVRHIAGLHGGTVAAESEPPDGVVFRVVLPRAAAAE